MPRQRTLRETTAVSGVALHTGNRVKLAMRPAPPDSGIVFRRTDLAGSPSIPAHVRHVVDVRRATTIAQGEAKVHTVEHVLAALHALQVDNAVVEMSGAEPPVGDGSAAAFVEMIRAAGMVEQEAEARFVEAPHILYEEAGETRMVVVPDSRFRVSCTVKFDASAMDCQYLSLEVTPDAFARELSLARTFCQYHEIEALMAANLIRGGSLDNAVVLKGDAVLSKEGLRYADEFVRHKMLDMVGDLYLAGGRFRGHVIAVRPGHPTNVAMTRRICECIGGRG